MGTRIRPIFYAGGLWVSPFILALLIAGCGGASEAEYQPDYFNNGILWFPGRETCDAFWPGWCRDFDQEYYLQIIAEYPSTASVSASDGYIDRFAMLFFIPAGALDDGWVRANDFPGYHRADAGESLIPGIVAAAARIPVHVAEQHQPPNGFRPGIFLVDRAGHYYPGQVDEAIREDLMKLFYEDQVDRSDGDVEHYRLVYLARPIDLEQDCAQQMITAPSGRHDSVASSRRRRNE